jgi:hypothetical protein
MNYLLQLGPEAFISVKLGVGLFSTLIFFVFRKKKVAQLGIILLVIVYSVLLGWHLALQAAK